MLLDYYVVLEGSNGVRVGRKPKQSKKFFKKQKVLLGNFDCVADVLPTQNL